MFLASTESSPYEALITNWLHKQTSGVLETTHGVTSSTLADKPEPLLPLWIPKEDPLGKLSAPGKTSKPAAVTSAPPGAHEVPGAGAPSAAAVVAAAFHNPGDLSPRRSSGSPKWSIAAFPNLPESVSLLPDGSRHRSDAPADDLCPEGELGGVFETGGNTSRDLGDVLSHSFDGEKFGFL